MKNLEIAKIFNEIADILEIKDDNPFRIRAYRKAALNLESLTEDLEKIAAKDALREIPGIGADLAAKIKEYLETGEIKHQQKLKKEIPPHLLELLSIPGVGPKTAKLVHEKLKVKSVEDMERLAREGKLKDLPGFKEKSEENILHGIELFKRAKERMPLGTALPVAVEISGKLSGLPSVKEVSPAGSLRRMKDTVRDIDILVSSEKPEEVMETFIKMENVKDVLAKGHTKSSIRFKDDVQVDVRVVEPESYGAALVYFTGSKAHNIHIRKIAIEKGWKVNEYGVFEEKTKRKLAGKSEEEVYRRLGLPFIPPELREDLGEIEAAQKGKLPRLVERTDIKGDLHVHSKWSDGGLSIEDMARAAQKLGYEYIAITDHSKSLGIARGLDEKAVAEQLKEIEGVNRRLKNFTVLSGTEVDIKSDGTLDLSEEILERLDVVVAAVHSGFKQGRQTLTRRIIKAVENKDVDIIAHPTGRLMGSRDSYDLDFDDIFKAASNARTVFEINAYPERLDLTDINCRRAKEAGVLMAISTDAHAASQFENIKFGLAAARRGWLEKSNVANCLSLNSLRTFLRRRL